MRRAQLRATQRHAQLRPAVNDRGHHLTHAKKRSQRRSSAGSSAGHPTASQARLLKTHALGAHCEKVTSESQRRTGTPSPVDEMLIANAAAFLGTAMPQPRPRTAHESRPPTAIDNDAGTLAAEPQEDAHHPTFRSWMPPDRAHEMFMASIRRERHNFQHFAHEETTRRESVWQGWETPAAVPKRTRVPTQAEETRESLRRPRGRGFNGPQWDPTEGFVPEDVQPDSARVEQLLARTRKSMVGYCYDHQGYVG